MPPESRINGLILWDVDHTLIETRGVGADLYKAAFEAAMGSPMKERADVTGATEPEIFWETARANGLHATEDDLRRYAGLLAQQYDQHRPRLRDQGRRLPGAEAALKALGGVDGLVQTALTGNLRAVAVIKLEVFDLASLLDLTVGAYGEDSDERPGLVAVAQQRAAAKYGQPFSRTNTVIVGDSPSDVRTGKEGGAAVLGVASGKSDASELANAGADFTLDDLRDPAELVRRVTALLDL